MKIVIGYLYPDLMNIYGDTGNIIALKKRAEWRGIEVEVKNISVGDKLKTGDVDIFFFGGGQDIAQELVAKDLVKSDKQSLRSGDLKGKVIKKEVERGVPLLSICGGYQLLGEYYQPHEGPKLPGVGVFPAYTVAGNKRMIGNIVIQTSAIRHQLSDKEQNNSDDLVLMADDYLIGFENHSGRTYLKEGATPLGKVVKGFGNNGEDQTEGCIHKNAIGCYMHGSLLPKNPELADWLLKTAAEVKYGKTVELKPLDDTLEISAHRKIISKYS